MKEGLLSLTQTNRQQLASVSDDLNGEQEPEARNTTQGGLPHLGTWARMMKSS